MAQLPMMPVYPDALIADTTHLSTEEFGAYALILMAIWRNNGKPYSDDHDLAHICRVSIKRWRNALRPRLAPFFDLSDGKWFQKRLDLEWENASKLAAISRANGARGGRRKARKSLNGSNPAGIPAGNPETNPERTQSDSIQIHLGYLNLSNPSSAHAREGTASPGSRAKEKLRQKLMRYCNATMSGVGLTRALSGLSGADPEHNDQWWLDHIDQQRRREGWDDTREWKPQTGGMRS